MIKRNMFNIKFIEISYHALKNVPWIQWFLIISSICVSIVLLFIPLIMIFVFALSSGLKIVVLNLINKDMLHAISLTIVIALIAVPVNSVFGVLMAWLVTRFEFYGKQLLLILLNIPVAISPVIAGLLYLLCYSSNSLIGSWLDLYNIQIMFTWLGILLVTIFITCPLIANELIPVMINQGNQEDEAAFLLGASGWMIFRYVTFPNIRWAFLCGVMVANSRVIGEFGASSVVSGLIRGETYTLPLHIELLYQEYNIIGAFIAASLLALISIIMLFVKSYFKFYIK